MFALVSALIKSWQPLSSSRSTVIPLFIRYSSINRRPTLPCTWRGLKICLHTGASAMAPPFYGGAYLVPEKREPIFCRAQP